MAHMLPHWNHMGMEGQNINVWVYTNCEECELLLNGERLGRRKAEPYTHLEWDVAFVPDASCFVRFRATGGKIVGTGSDESDHVPVPCPARQMYAGLISVAVKPAEKAEKITLIAESNTVQRACLTVELGSGRTHVDTYVKSQPKIEVVIAEN